MQEGKLVQTGDKEMSKWVKIKAVDIDISDDCEEIEILVTSNDDGNIYAEIEIDMLFKKIIDWIKYAKIKF
jgi:hypothetical protein